jgi:hypothetical protein
MSWFRIAAYAAVAAILTVSIACGSTMTPATAPSAVTYTDVFSGTLPQGGTSYGTDNGNHFTVHQAGNLTATITKLSPLSTITVGLGIGVYDATSSTCALQLFADTAKLNLVLSANTSSGGELCVGLYDVGNVVDPVDYEVSVTHT